MSGAKVVAYRNRIKLALITSFGNKCHMCNKKYDRWVYEFHHIDSATKSFGIGNTRTTRSIKLNAEEAKKCVMVCANCHRIAEYSGIDFGFKSDFDEERFYKEISELNGTAERQRYNEREKQKNKLISEKKSIKPNRQELKDLLRNKSFTEIAKVFGVSDNGIRKWAISYGLPNRVIDIKSITDSDWESI